MIFSPTEARQVWEFLCFDSKKNGACITAGLALVLVLS